MESFLIGLVIFTNVIAAIATIYYRSIRDAPDLPEGENSWFWLLIFVFPGVLVGLLIFYVIIGPFILLIRKINDDI